MIWIIHFAVVTILLISAIKSKKNNVFIYGAFLYSVFIFGQRWMTGEDFPNYLLYYLINFQGREFLYFYLQDLFIKLDLYFGIFVFLIYLATQYNFFKFIIKIKKNTLLMLYIYLLSEIYFVQLSQIRQLMAVSFFVNVCIYMYQNKKILAMINVLLAMGFHISTILVLPFLLIQIIKPKITRASAFFILMFFCLLPLINIKFILNFEIVNIYLGYIGSVFDTGLSIFHYFKYYIIVFMALFYFYNMKSKSFEKQDYLIIYYFLIYIALYGLGFKFALIFRVANYFKIYEIVFFIYFLDDIKIITRNLLKGVVSTIFLVFYLSVTIIDPYSISNYQFRLLRLNEDKTISQLYSEINNFHTR